MEIGIGDEKENTRTLFRIIPQAITIGEGDRYILDLADSYLYRDCGNEKCEFVSDLGQGNGENAFEYRTIIKLGDEIVVVPFNSKDFLLYNVAKKETRHIYVDKKLYENNINCPGFYKAVPYENKIFIIKHVCNAIFCIDKDTLEITCSNIFDDTERDWKLFRMLCDVYSYGNLLYIPLMETNTFIIFNMEDCTHEIRQLQEDIKMATVCGCGDEMYIVAMHGKEVYVLNLSKWTIQNTINIAEPCGLVRNADGYWYGYGLKYNGSIYYKGKLWLMPYAASNMIVRADLSDGSTECACQYDMLRDIFNYSKNGSVLWICTDRGTIKIDMDTLESAFMDYFHKRHNDMAYWKHKLNYGIVIDEKWLAMEDYIKLVVGNG